MNKFVPGPYPRMKTEMSEVKRTSYGFIVQVGKLFEDQHVWSFSVFLPLQQVEILDAIYWEHHRRRRNNEYPQILLVDTTLPFQEKAPQTRATAPSPFDVITYLDPPTNSYISYYAQYNVVFSKKPEYEYKYLYAIATISLEETESKVDP